MSPAGRPTRELLFRDEAVDNFSWTGVYSPYFAGAFARVGALFFDFLITFIDQGGSSNSPNQRAVDRAIKILEGYRLVTSQVS